MMENKLISSTLWKKTSNLEKPKKCDLLVVSVDRQKLYEEIIKQQ